MLFPLDIICNLPLRLDKVGLFALKHFYDVIKHDIKSVLKHYEEKIYKNIENITI